MSAHVVFNIEGKSCGSGFQCGVTGIVTLPTTIRFKVLRLTTTGSPGSILSIHEGTQIQ